MVAAGGEGDEGMQQVIRVVQRCKEVKEMKRKMECAGFRFHALLLEEVVLESVSLVG